MNNGFFLLAVCGLLLPLNIANAELPSELDGIQQPLTVKDIGRDPTQPLFYQRKHTQDRPNFKLQAIYQKGAIRTAVINSKTVRKGEFFGQWQVISINAEKVVLQKNAETLSLSLQQSIVKY